MLQWHIGLNGHLTSWHLCNNLYKALRTLHSIYLFIEVNMTWSIKSDHYIKGRSNCWNLVVWICDSEGDESCSLFTDCVTQSMQKALHCSRYIFFGLAFPPFQVALEAWIHPELSIPKVIEGQMWYNFLGSHSTSVKHVQMTFFISVAPFLQRAQRT